MKDWVAHYRDVKRRLMMAPQRAPVLIAPLPVEEVKAEEPSFPPLPTKKEVPVPNTRNARRLVQPVLLKHGVSWDEATGPSRRACYIQVRREIYFTLREAGWSLGAIGTFMKRDHTTIIHALREYEKGELSNAE